MLVGGLLLLGAERAAVARFTVVGFKDAEALSKMTAELGRAAAVAEGYEVLNVPDIVDEDRADALLKAHDAGADVLVTGSLINFRNNIILWVSLLNTSDGSVVYQDKVRLYTKDEVQEGIQAVIRAAHKKDKRAQEYYEEIILEEKGITSAKSSYVTAGLLMGAVIPAVPNSLGQGGALNGGEVFLNYETPFWTGRLGTGFFRSDSSAMTPIGFLEALYSPRGNKDISPYLAASAGFAYFKTWQEGPDSLDDYTYGWLFKVKGGMMFFRTYQVRLLLEVGYAVLASEVQRIGTYPNGLYASVGFAYQAMTSPF